MVIKGIVNGVQTKVLLDTGASGTGFVSRKFCNDEKVELIPAKPNTSVIMGDNSVVPATHLAVISIRFGHFKSKTQCLVVDNMADYSLILGNPWLNHYEADMSFQRKHVVLKKSNGHYACIKTYDQEEQKDEDIHLNFLGESTLHSDVQHSDIRPLSTNKVVQLAKKGKVDDAFLFLLRSDEEDPNSLQNQEDDPLLRLIPGNTLPEQAMRVLIGQNQDLFKTDYTHFDDLEHSRSVIPLIPDAKIPNRPMFRYSPSELAEMHSQVDALLNKGLIQKSSSPFGAPILFVKKKSGELRMCVDYRALNKITIPNRYPLPRIDDLLDRMQGSSVFTSLDLFSAYQQVKLKDEDIQKTAFRTPFGLFEYKVLPFGLTNAPSAFMSVINDAIADLPFAVVYLDDILIFSRSPEEHVKHVEIVLKRLRENHFALKMKKCEFFKSQIPYLGHIISKDGITPDPKKLSAVQSWPTPNSVLDVRSFLGLANYFRRYIQKFSEKAAPLINLTKGNVSKRKSATTAILWTEECQQSFEKMKQALTSAPTLKMPDFTQPFEVITDASDFALGAILIQQNRPVAFESRVMNSAEKKLSYN
jgi:predicted aspartyl protease